MRYKGCFGTSAIIPGQETLLKRSHVEWAFGPALGKEGGVMQKAMFLRFGFVLFYLIAWATFSHCLGQATTQLEDSLPQQLRNRSDVELIVQKLRFLRTNEANFGENHPSKKSNQAQIRDYESALNSIIELNSLPSPKSSALESSMNIEDSLPQELRNRSDVALILRKLRFLRVNDSNFGEKHPNKKSTQLQIRENELALNRIMEVESLKTTKSAISENSMNIEDILSQELRNREDVNLLVLQLLYLRINLTSFRENHPDRNAIQDQLQRSESALLAITKSEAKPTVRKRSTKSDVTVMQALEERKDLQVLLHKLTILRLNEENFGEEHPKMKTIKAEIREHEAALVEIIKLDQRANTKANPFRRRPVVNDLRREPSESSR